MGVEIMASLPNQFPVPPVDMLMPQLLNLIFTMANFSILLVVAIFLLRSCKRDNTPLPMLFLFGGMFGYITDSFLRAFNISVPN